MFDCIVCLRRCVCEYPAQERARLETQIAALKRHHEELVLADEAAEEELAALKRKAADLHSALQEADQIDAEAADEEQNAEAAARSGNVSAAVLRQQLADVREKVQRGAQHQTRVHADLADALSEAALLKTELAALMGVAAFSEKNNASTAAASSSELSEDEAQLGAANNALTSLHAQLVNVQSELKASLRQQEQERALSSDVEVRLVLVVVQFRGLALSHLLSLRTFPFASTCTTTTTTYRLVAQSGGAL